MATATANICPVVGTTTNVLPPHHPAVSSDPEARCPITNAKVSHHDDIIHHTHPSDDHIPSDDKKAMDASACPALKNANTKEALTDATCPVVGPVNAHLPPQHPVLKDLESKEGEKAVCPVTNATLGHHKGNVKEHVLVEKDAPAGKCPVAGAQMSA